MDLSSSNVEKTWKPFVLGCITGSLLMILLFHSQANFDYMSLLSIAESTTQYNHSSTIDPIKEIEIPSLATYPQVKASSSPPPIREVEAPSRQLEPINGRVEIAEVKTSRSPVGKGERIDDEEKKSCNIFRGRWVYKPNGEGAASGDAGNYAEKCPFIDRKFNCRRNGRMDFEFEKWSWEPSDCAIPLLNPREMLERLRGKRMIMVGDSLNRNQYESLACLLYTSVPPSTATYGDDLKGHRFLKAKDYNFTLEFYWSPFLLEMDESKENRRKVLKLDKPHSYSKQWQGADVMLFNSGHWWQHSRWDALEYEGKSIHNNMPAHKAFEIGMKTWASWISDNVDPTKTTVFFRSVAPTHFAKHYCFNISQPILDESFSLIYPTQLIEAIENLIEETNKKTRMIKYLNITKLSGYRRDAHPSVYQSTKWKDKGLQNQTVVRALADCSHWCLPGLPDTWNRLLYASLFFHS